MNTTDDADFEEVIHLLRESGIPPDKLLKAVKFIIQMNGVIHMGVNQDDCPVIKEPSIIERMMKSLRGNDSKLNRIIWIRQHFGYGLMQAKEWVETHFSDKGSGAPLK